MFNGKQMREGPKQGRLQRWLAVVLMILLAMETTMTQAMTRTESDIEARNKATVQAGFDAWKNGTGSPYNALADDATWEIVGNSAASRIYTSKADFLNTVIGPFNARMSGRLIPSIRRLYAEGDDRFLRR